MKQEGDQVREEVQRGARGRWLLSAIGIAALTVTGVAVLAGPGLAFAAPTAPGLLWQTPEDGIAGSTGGRFEESGSVAADPANGHVYVASKGKVSEFDVWGQFIKSWGWGAVASGPDNKPAVNEIQELTVSATSGTFQLTYFNESGDANPRRQTTSALPFNATSAQVQSALEGLESISPGDVQVSGGPGDGTGSSPYDIEFIGGLADTDIPPLVSTASLSGGSASASVKTSQEGGSFEVCVPANGDACARGQAGGSNPGQIRGAVGIAVTGTGAVYVSEQMSDEEVNGVEMNFRVQKFDSTGSFAAMWGGEVNKTKSSEIGTTEAERNLCTKAEMEGGDVCGAGVPACTRVELQGGKTCGVDVPAPGDGQFKYTSSLAPSGGIAIGPEGSVFVADDNRIQRFDGNGVFLGEVGTPGRRLNGLAMDSAGNFFVTAHETNITPADDVVELSPGGLEVRSFAVPEAAAVAVGASGDVYAVSQGLGIRDRIVVYDNADNKLIPTEEEEAAAAQRESEGRKGERFGETGASLTGLATGTGCEIPGEDLYVFNAGTPTALRAYGPAPQDPACEPPAVPPSINDQYAASVATDTAVLRAKINPHFWQNTTYYVEYGTSKCSEGGCTSQQPLPPGSNLTEEVTSAQLLGTASLSGLTPGTTYHYRFVAQSGGGGPVRGVGGNLVTDGQEASFTTLALPKPHPCPNDEFRVGHSAGLADCRAYEMVSPIDKNNGDILALTAEDNRPAALDQSSLDGGKMVYSSYRSFGDAQSAPITVAYMATRGEGGWASQAISPPGGATVIEPIHAVNNQFKAFSPDLCTSWLREESGQVLASGAIPGYANLYRRQNCGSAAGSYAALTVPTAPLHREPKFFVPEFQGVSGDGSAVVFRVSDSLIPGAPDPGLEGPMVYEASGEIELHLVCVLPNGTPVATGCSVGTGGFPYGRGESAYHALSADGSRVYWSAAKSGPGKIYLREHSDQPPSEIVSGKCVQAELACTIPVSSEPARFWGGATDGSKAFYTTGDFGNEEGEGKATLFEFDAEAKTSNQIAGKVDGVLGISDDGSRIYLVSEEELDAGAAGGKPNLYLYEGGQFTFIGQLSRSDAGAKSPTQVTPVHVEPRFHVAQVTSNGENLVFMSNSAALSEATAEYNNTDLNSGEADLEVYLYDAPSGALRCVSCNPTGARPAGASIAVSTDKTKQWAAARIPTSESGAYLVPQVISPDGGRLFFESFEALAGGDTNGKKDVYEWEAPGKGDCEESSPSFDPKAAGCLALISSGESATNSEITAVSQSGDDAFFATSQSLLPQDPGLIDVYDARVGGGFPQAVVPVECEGEECPNPPPPPPGSEPAPASSTFQGPESVAKKTHKKHKHRKHRHHKQGPKSKGGHR